MSFYFRDSPRFADRLSGMSDDELLREMKQRFNKDKEGTVFESGRPTRTDSFDRPFSHFPRGFPFDDDADVFERPRSDGIRAHLDDLAARHPEFAEHLRGPPWPFNSSLLRDRRCRRRGSNNDDQQQQGQQHQDEDARSQASGSSAASGASAVSSHSGGGGEHDLTSSSAIPQYGLRNTVDIGQQQRRRDMETSPEKDERGQRSMSAPPTESWQQQQPGQEQQLPPQPGQGQRFVSRVDITPQHNQQRAQSPGKPTSNVRHIPIFVEGRDVPVMPKVATDDAPPSTFQQQQSSPPSHHFDRSSPPAHHFHRPSHFNERFNRQQWPPSNFQTFYKTTVDDLAEEVRRYVGGSRQDKEYMYLDEMLTRELIKLDDIETEGRENVRQARKNAIKSIQDTIGLLETKTPFAGTTTHRA
ncbi:BAG domain-containing protein Samui [Trachymyrmex zeteki]|uniref:BAG domain-containing protein Samui n=1 Tax=Mycetomoellerius zeteki TaxID=64791 RepID=A0A151WP40_9HYME|nr:BAG domain-containing protein Samui [Trachymyrmex zeteki]